MVRSKDDLVITTDVDNAKAKAGFKQLGNQAQTTGKSITKSVLAANLAAEALSRFASGVAGAMADAVANFTNFEEKFSNVVTLLDSNTPTAKIDSLKNGVLDLGVASGQTFDDLNQGLFDIVSSGAAAGSELRVLAAATNLATAGAASVDVSTKALVSTLTSFGDEAGTAEEIAVKFFAAQKRGITNIAQLGGEFNKVAGLAKTLGVSFDETLASATSLTNDGAKPTSEAFTNLRSLMSGLVIAQGKLKNESKEVQDALSLENVKAIGLVGALDQFKTATGGSIVELQRMLGSTEAVSGAIALTGEQQKTFNTILGDFQNKGKSAAEFADALGTKLGTLDTNTDQMTRAWEAMTIVLVDKVAPALKSVLELITDTIQAASKSKRPMGDFLEVITGFKFLAAVFDVGVEQIDKALEALGVTLNNSRNEFDLLVEAGERSLKEQKKISGDVAKNKKEEAAKTEAIAKANAEKLKQIEKDKLDFILKSNQEFATSMNQLVSIEKTAAEEAARIRKASDDNRASAMRQAVVAQQDIADSEKKASAEKIAAAEKIAEISKTQREFVQRQLLAAVGNLKNAFDELNIAKNAFDSYTPTGKGKPGAPDLSLTPAQKKEDDKRAAQLRAAERRARSRGQTSGPIDEKGFFDGAGDSFGNAGLSVAGQITGVGGAIAGFQQGGPMGAAAGFVTEILLSNKEFQEALGELSAIIQEAFGPIIHELIPILQSVSRILRAMSPAIQKLAPAVEVLAKSIEFQTDVLLKFTDSLDGVGKTLEALSEPLTSLGDSMGSLDGSVESLQTAVEKLTEPIQDLIDAISGLSGGGGGALGGAVSGLINTVGGAFGFADGSPGLKQSDLLRLPGMEPGSGLIKAHAGEMVIPKSFQMDTGLRMPIAKNLQLSDIKKAVSGIGAGVGDQRIIVDVIISPSEMTNFISAKQREQSRLGISRQ